jgi:cystathionine beta-lyase
MQFDKIIDRTPSNAYKWERYKGRDILPMWIADTEFRCAEPILDALKARAEHGLLGYTLPNHAAGAIQAVVDWMAKQYDWKIEPQWLVWTPGVVPGFNMACQAFCQPGDKVIVQTPNYPPMLAAPKLNGLARADVPTVEVDGKWMLDFDVLEQHAKDPQCTLFILCNPMNPVGSVLDEAQLTRVADICAANNVMLCSDEIHCDLILDKAAKHIPAGKLASAQNNSVTLMAASKTFNVAGLGTSFAIIPDAKVRQRFTQAGQGLVPWVNVMGLAATEAAFTQCDDWLAAQLDYLRANRDYLVEQINQIEGLRVIAPQATFLAWIDASGLGVENPQAYFEEKGVGPSPGIDFGDKQFVRINFGCPRSQLEHAINCLKA